MMQRVTKKFIGTYVEVVVNFVCCCAVIVFFITLLVGLVAGRGNQLYCSGFSALMLCLGLIFHLTVLLS